MPDASTLRDSTQITLPARALEEVPVETEFTVTVIEQAGQARIIGSPVEIKRVSDFLARHGVSLP
jgi:hypothetical protein